MATVELRSYQDAQGRKPFDAWLDGLRDATAKKRVLQRLTRLEAGLFGDAKPVGAGVLELRIDYGPGYRVYFGRHGTALVLLLIGGDKRMQDADIARAKSYWNDWKNR